MSLHSPYKESRYYNGKLLSINTLQMNKQSCKNFLRIKRRGIKSHPMTSNRDLHCPDGQGLVAAAGPCEPIIYYGS